MNIEADTEEHAATHGLHGLGESCLGTAAEHASVTRWEMAETLVEHGVEPRIGGRGGDRAGGREPPRVRTTATIPDRPAVLDATVLSNVAYLDRVELLEVLSRPVAVPGVRDGLVRGARSYPHLEAATAALPDPIPVVSLETVPDDRPEVLDDTRDRGEAAAVAVAAGADGLLVTDDGAARDLAADRDLAFTGSIGVLVRLVEGDEVEASTADDWLKRWVDETTDRAPARDLSEYL